MCRVKLSLIVLLLSFLCRSYGEELRPIFEVEGRHDVVQLAGDSLYATVDNQWQRVAMWELTNSRKTPEATFEFLDRRFLGRNGTDDFLLVPIDRYNPDIGLELIRAGDPSFQIAGTILFDSIGPAGADCQMRVDGNRVLYARGGFLAVYELSAAGVRALEPVPVSEDGIILGISDAFGITTMSNDRGSLGFYAEEGGAVTLSRTVEHDLDIPEVLYSDGRYLITRGDGYMKAKVFHIGNDGNPRTIWQGGRDFSNGAVHEGVFWYQHHENPFVSVSGLDLATLNAAEPWRPQYSLATDSVFSGVDFSINDRHIAIGSVEKLWVFENPAAQSSVPRDFQPRR